MTPKDASTVTTPLPLEGREALRVRGITFDFSRRRALDDVSFGIGVGETVILLGPNGAGKTTLFSLISGLFSPQTGSIEIAGQDVTKTGAAALEPLGIVFQAQTLDLDLSVRQNLRYFCALRGIDRKTADQRIAEELGRMNMGERADEKVRTLNGGHRRRVEIARAALHKPLVLLLDEPTVGLDIPTRRELIADLHARSRNDGTALLWATHLIDEIGAGDRVMVLHEGRLVASGTPRQLEQETGASSLDAAFAALTPGRAAA